MSAITFANHSKTAPNPNCANHGGGPFGLVKYTCHMAAMHWAFMDKGDTQAIANQRVSAVSLARCSCIHNGGTMHSSVPYQWYSNAFCGGAQLIQNRAALFDAVNIGDVLIVGSIQAPMHTMVVVKKSSILGQTWVYIRGFNNVGTLGTGQYLDYDNCDRNIDQDQYWHGPAGGKQAFGNGPGNNLYVIPYYMYSNSAGVIRGQCFARGGGPFTYHGI